MAAGFERLAKRSSADTAAAVDPEAVRNLGLERFSSNIIVGMIRCNTLNSIGMQIL